jgi:hypothetical protein
MIRKAVTAKAATRTMRVVFKSFYCLVSPKNIGITPIGLASA